MKFNINYWMRVAMLVAIGAVSFACSNELTQSAAPVELIVSNVQALTRIDVDPTSQDQCDTSIGSVEFRAILKNPNADVSQQFNDVRITRYRVSYVRTDGGTLVPAPFVRSIDLIVPAGGTATFDSPVLLQSDAVVQQPFVALRPQNGGRDPETGRTTVRMDAVVDFFGETLAGSNVAGRTRFPLDFCFDCDGCS
jgi:hypothetical protein